MAGFEHDLPFVYNFLYHCTTQSLDLIELCSQFFIFLIVNLIFSSPWFNWYWDLVFSDLFTLGVLKHSSKSWIKLGDPLALIQKKHFRRHWKKSLIGIHKIHPPSLIPDINGGRLFYTLDSITCIYTPFSFSTYYISPTKNCLFESLKIFK